LATGASYRKENYTAEIPYLDLSSSFKREVKAGYAELYAPIASPENSVALLHELALSGAVRYDHYSDFGGTTNTRFGAVWAPWRQLRLRVARSTSFRAPSARQKLAAAPGFQFILNLPFPSPSGGSEPVFLLTGSELNLAPERSKNFFASADLVPFPDRSLVIGIDYYRIDFRNRIVSPPIDFGALLHPGLYGSIIRPFASDAEAEAFLQDQLALGAIFFPVLPSGSTGIRNAINVRAQNAAKVVQSGFDIRATFKHEFAAGNLNANLNLAHIDKILTSFIGASQSVDIVDTYGNPLATRLRASLGWATDVYQLTGTLNHSGAYRNPSTIPESRIAAWTTADFDLQLRDRASGFVFGLSILNAFDSKPPKAINPIFPGIGFDPANASAIGRFVSVQVRKTW
jgi:outer membrane receptor protein involved in Fe transport